MYFIIALVFVVYIVSCDRFDPTKSEIKRALAFQELKGNWGYQARQERELRLFAFGGSNTRNIHYPNAIRRDLDFKHRHPDWSGTIHRLGLGGAHDNDVVGVRLDFESWNSS